MFKTLWAKDPALIQFMVRTRFMDGANNSCLGQPPPLPSSAQENSQYALDYLLDSADRGVFSGAESDSESDISLDAWNSESPSSRRRFVFPRLPKYLRFQIDMPDDS